jgi:hypothetical protein
MPPPPPLGRFQFTLRQLMGFVTLVAVVLGLIMWYVQAARIAREEERCQYNLRTIRLALYDYWQYHSGRNPPPRPQVNEAGRPVYGGGYLPPSRLLDKDGKPLCSWRLFIRPFMDTAGDGIPTDWRQPWNAPINREFGTVMGGYYHCPVGQGTKSCMTDYVAVVGPDTIWRDTEPAKLPEDDAGKDKILVIEIVNSDIHWMEPRDLTLDEALDMIQPKKGVGIGSRHPSGIHYLTVGGDVRILDRNIDRESLRRLFTRGPANTGATTGKNPTSR